MREAGRIVTVEVNVLDHLPPRVKSQPYRVRVSDDSAVMELVYFRAQADWLNTLLPLGTRRVLSGQNREVQGHIADAPPRLMWWRPKQSRVSRCTSRSMA